MFLLPKQRIETHSDRGMRFVLRGDRINKIKRQNPAILHRKYPNKISWRFFFVCGNNCIEKLESKSAFTQIAAVFKE